MTNLYRDVSIELKLPMNNSVIEEMESKNKEEITKLTGILERLLVLQNWAFCFKL